MVNEYFRINSQCCIMKMNRIYCTNCDGDIISGMSFIINCIPIKIESLPEIQLFIFEKWFLSIISIYQPSNTAWTPTATSVNRNLTKFFASITIIGVLESEDICVSIVWIISIGLDFWQSSKWLLILEITVSLLLFCWKVSIISWFLHISLCIIEFIM